MASGRGRVARVMAQPQRHPKSGVLRLRRAIPAALQERVAALQGKPAGSRTTELIRSLRTHDVREAKLRMVAAEAWADGLLAEAARPSAERLTNRQLHALAGLHYTATLAAIEDDPDALADRELWADVTEPNERGELALHREDARGLAAAHGIKADDVSLQRLGDLMGWRQHQAMIRARRRQGGDYGADLTAAQLPAFDPVAAPAAPPVAISALFERWSGVATVKPRTRADAKYAVNSLVSFLGHDDATRADRREFIRWREAMKAAGKTNATFNNRLSMIGEVFRHAVTDELLSADPTVGLRLRKNKPKSPLPYSDDDAVRILLAARQETRPSLRWAHWVMAFSGMRVSEVLQLTGGDVRREGAIWFLSVNEDGAGKSVKTGQPRNVPVHPALIAEGFLYFAHAVVGDGPLFPDKGLDSHGSRGGRAWQVTGRWVRKAVGITDPTKAPDHSWRHRVEDELRAAQVPEDARDALVGHARKTVGRAYGIRGEALARLYDCVCRLPVPAGL